MFFLLLSAESAGKTERDPSPPPRHRERFMKRRIEFSPAGTPCPARRVLAARRPASSHRRSRSFISGFESALGARVTRVDLISLPFLLSFPPPPTHEGTRKIVCRVDSATALPLPKKICLLRAPESSGPPSFHCTLQLKEGVSRQAPRLPPRPGGSSSRLCLTGSAAWRSVCFPAAVEAAGMG